MEVPKPKLTLTLPDGSCFEKELSQETLVRLSNAIALQQSILSFEKKPQDEDALQVRNTLQHWLRFMGIPPGGNVTF